MFLANRLSTSINLDETLKYLAIFGYMATTGEKDQLSAVYSEFRALANGDFNL